MIPRLNIKVSIIYNKQEAMNVVGEENIILSKIIKNKYNYINNFLNYPGSIKDLIIFLNYTSFNILINIIINFIYRN